MSQDNAKLYRQFVEAANRAEFDRFDEFIAPDAVDHNPLPGQVPGLDGVKQSREMVKQAFPDSTSEIVALVSEGDTVAGTQVLRGTNQGSFMGAPPTGRSIEIVSNNWVRYADGMAVERRGLADRMGLMLQLGMMPMPPGTEGWKPDLASPPAEGDVLSPEENKTFVQRGVALLNEGRLEEFLSIVHPNAVDHTAIPGQSPGPIGWQQRFAMFGSAFSDAGFDILAQLSEGDLVSGHYTFRGRHTGDLMGMPATGNAFEVEAMDMIRVRTARSSSTGDSSTCRR